MGDSRVLRSSSKPLSIGDKFIALTRSSNPQPSSSSAVIRRPLSAASGGPAPLRTLSEVEADHDEDNVPYPDDQGEPDEPVDETDDNPDGNPPPDPDEPAAQPEQTLAQSLTVLAGKIAEISKPSQPQSKVQQRSPDIFDGTDSGKLDTFVFQCSMFIAARGGDFPDSESRVSFALSYLKGVPLDWFQGDFASWMDRSGTPPPWFTSYPIFLQELRRLFGPRDPVADATNALEGLKYKDSTKAARYTIEFNRHAHRTGWNDTALTRQYYKALPDRLKDEISRIGKPADLRTLQDLVSTLDQRYWERQSEISREKRSTSNPTSTSQQKTASADSRNDHRSGNNNSGGSKPNHQSKNKDQKKTPPANSSGSGNKTNSISDLLGPDGKLKPDERQRRIDNNLCLRCAKPGHMVSNCTFTPKAKPKGRAATISTTSSSATPASSSGSGKA
jgi:hypothetical protein